MKLHIQKDTCTPVSIAALLMMANMREQLKCPSGEEWRKKAWNMYTVEYYLAVKKNGPVPLAATRMDLVMVTGSEVSDTVEDKFNKDFKNWST